LAIEELGFDQPMPIQARTIPFIQNQNSDLVALAQTGTGKTARIWPSCYEHAG